MGLAVLAVLALARPAAAIPFPVGSTCTCVSLGLPPIVVIPAPVPPVAPLVVVWDGWADEEDWLHPVEIEPPDAPRWDDLPALLHRLICVTPTHPEDGPPGGPPVACVGCGPSGSPPGSGIPEPALVALLAVGLAAAARRRR